MTEKSIEAGETNNTQTTSSLNESRHPKKRRESFKLQDSEPYEEYVPSQPDMVGSLSEKEREDDNSHNNNLSSNPESQEEEEETKGRIGPDRSYRDHMPPKKTAFLPLNKTKSEPEKNPRDLAKDQPTHTLFIRNIDYDVTESHLRKLFEPFGEIKRFFTNLVKLRGIAFISYYDIRHTMKAKEALHLYPLSNDRQIEVYYAIPAPADKARPVEDIENDGNSGSLHVFFRPEEAVEILDEDVLIETDFVRKMYSKFGELRNVKQMEKKNNFLVEFFNLRDCQAALDETDKKKLPEKHFVLNVKFFYPKPKENNSSTGKKDFSRNNARGGKSTKNFPRPYADHAQKHKNDFQGNNRRGMNNYRGNNNNNNNRFQSGQNKNGPHKNFNNNNHHQNNFSNLPNQGSFLQQTYQGQSASSFGSSQNPAFQQQPHQQIMHQQPMFHGFAQTGTIQQTMSAPVHALNQHQPQMMWSQPMPQVSAMQTSGPHVSTPMGYAPHVSSAYLQTAQMNPHAAMQAMSAQAFVPAQAQMFAQTANYYQQNQTAPQNQFLQFQQQQQAMQHQQQQQQQAMQQQAQQQQAMAARQQQQGPGPQLFSTGQLQKLNDLWSMLKPQGK